MEISPTVLNLIREALLRNFTIEELEESGWAEHPPDKALILQLAEIDLEFFCRHYLPHHFDRTPAPLHRDTYRTIQSAMLTPGRVNNVVVWPRGHGKSTTVTCAVPLWCVLFHKRRFIIIISDSHTQAKQQLATVKDELEHNELILEDFGDLRGEKWQEDDITTSNRIKITALGSGMKIRGRKFLQFRPDLLICDDLENLEEVRSPANREKMRDWFFRSVTKAGWNDTKTFVVGNYLHYDCLLKNLSDNPMFTSRIYKAVMRWADRQDLWDEWERRITNLSDPDKERNARTFFDLHREEMLQGVETAWPEALPYYDLMLTKITDGDNTFATELQNEPMDPSKQAFKKMFTYRMAYRDGRVWLEPNNGWPAVALNDCAVFGATDPSMGATAHSDYTAIVLLAKSPTNQMFVLVADIERIQPSEAFEKQIRYAEQFNIVRWQIEKNGFQALFSSESGRRSMESGVYLPIEPVNQLRNKDMRIGSLQPDLENGYILLNENGQELLKKQLREWVPGANHHDDGPDALETARTMAKNWESFDTLDLIQADTHKFLPSAVSARQLGIRIDPYDYWDELADKELYLKQVDAARERAILDGTDPDAAEREIPQPNQVFVPIMVL